MKCEEFEAASLERGGLRMSDLDAALRAAAGEHAAACTDCAALQESWQEARVALQLLRETTQGAQAPQRVEMRLRHEFGRRHRTAKARFAAVFSAWALAAATVGIGGISLWDWRLAQTSREQVSAADTVEAPTAVDKTAGTARDATT